MRKSTMLVVASLLAPTSQASATTYDYVGQPFTSFSGGCVNFSGSTCSKVTGSVTFNFDTSQFTGSITLGTGDTAFLTEGIPLPSPFSPLVPAFPALTWVTINPTIPFIEELSGSFTLTNGTITSWSLSGSTRQEGCAGGPGCESGSSSVSSTPSGDQSSAFQQATDIGGIWDASNNAGGIWTEE
jgi:hypothetical protein